MIGDTMPKFNVEYKRVTHSDIGVETTNAKVVVESFDTIPTLLDIDKLEFLTIRKVVEKKAAAAKTVVHVKEIK
jgi:hypothetical protein